MSHYYENHENGMSYYDAQLEADRLEAEAQLAREEEEAYNAEQAAQDIEDMHSQNEEEYDEDAEYIEQLMNGRTEVLSSYAAMYNENDSADAATMTFDGVEVAGITSLEDREVWSADALSEYIDAYKEKIGKHTEGKTAGARYFFLRELADKEHEMAAGYIHELIHSDFIEDKIDYCRFIIRELAGHMDDAIRIREQAIKSGKYSIDSYEYLRLEDENDMLDAVARHFIKSQISHEPDAESGYSHQGHIINNLLILISIYQGGF